MKRGFLRNSNSSQGSKKKRTALFRFIQRFGGRCAATCFLNCLFAIYLFLVQTGVLIIKNFISLIFHPINTAVRLLIPVCVMLGLIILNISSMDSDAKTKSEGSNSLNPKPIETPRLPKYAGEISLAWGPCVHENRTTEKNQRIKDKFFQISQTIADFNDRGYGPYGEKAEKLTIAPVETCFTTAEDLFKNCKHNICPVFDTRIIKNVLTPGSKKRVHAGVFFYFGDETTILTARALNSNDLFPDTQLASRMHYTVYYNSTSISSSPFFPVVRYTPFDYSSSIMRAVDEAIFQNLEKNETVVPGMSNIDPSLRPVANLKTYRKPFPANQGENVEKDKLIMLIGPLFFFVALYITNISIHYSINSERDLKLREAMRMMGLSNFAYWSSWFITETVVNFFVVIGMILTGYYCGLLFFVQSTPIATFLILFTMGESIIALFMALSNIVKSNTMTNISAFFVFLIFVCFLFFFIDFFGLLQSKTTIPLAVQAYNLPILNFMNVFPPFNFGKACYDISLTVKQELNGTQWQNSRFFGITDLFKTSPVYNDYSTSLSNGVPATIWNIIFMFLSVPFFLVLCWWLDNVIPDSYGRSRSWFFCCTPSFWGICTNSRDNIAVDFSLHNAKFHSILPDTDVDIFEEYQRVIKSVEDEGELPVDEQKFPLKIIKLSKTYKGGFLSNAASSKNALDNFTICSQLGSCLVLLGHNGSGKSTTVNALVGLQRPSAGDAIIFGYSAVNNSQSVQQIIGVCFQHDIVFPELSGMMHMILFATLKGIPFTQQYDEIKEKLNDVMLWTFRHQTASTYSGGMKRRLMVAIAMLGDPKMIFLDEPTSGMDPSVKRSIWDLIARYKKDRVIVLTTHSMEEAEAIGDKIAILALGRLRAVGTSLHLKNRFGAGYGVSFCTEPQFMNELKHTVSQISPNSKLVNETSAGTLNYTLPIDLTSEEVLKLFQFLENETAKAKQNFIQNVKNKENLFYVKKGLFTKKKLKKIQKIQKSVENYSEESKKSTEKTENEKRVEKKSNRISPAEFYAVNEPVYEPSPEVVTGSEEIYGSSEKFEKNSKTEEKLESEGDISENPVIEKILIKDWLLSHTTLEEVFLRLTHGKGSEGGVSNDDIVKKLQNSGSEGKGMQLNVRLQQNSAKVFAGEEILLGFVRINEKNTLADVREFIIEQNLLENADIGPMNQDFNFVLPGGVPISKQQESEMKGLEFLPSVTISPKKPLEDLAFGNDVEKPKFFVTKTPSRSRMQVISKVIPKQKEMQQNISDYNEDIQEIDISEFSNKLVQENDYLKQELQNIRKTLLEKFSDNEVLSRKQQLDQESIEKLVQENKILRKKLERERNPEIDIYSDDEEENAQDLAFTPKGEEKSLINRQNSSNSQKSWNSSSRHDSFSSTSTSEKKKRMPTFKTKLDIQS